VVKLIKEPIALNGRREYRFMQPSSLIVSVKFETDHRGGDFETDQRGGDFERK
jgi:hypothetical protein